MLSHFFLLSTAYTYVATILTFVIIVTSDLPLCRLDTTVYDEDLDDFGSHPLLSLTTESLSIQSPQLSPWRLIPPKTPLMGPALSSPSGNI